MKKWFKTNVVSLLPALLLVLVIRSSFLEAFKIPSGSMIPTLLIGDRLFVNKMEYGLRVPLLEWVMDKPLYFFKYKEPARGDIIVFKSPENPDIYLIKRIVGIPGDTVAMKKKSIYINGKAMERNPVPNAVHESIFDGMPELEDHYRRDRMKIYYDQYDHTTGTTMIDPEQFFSVDFPEVKVPEGQYFCMGDNRDDSKDSRFIGFIPFDNIKGRARIIWLNLWIDFEENQYIIHPTRIGTILR